MKSLENEDIGEDEKEHNPEKKEYVDQADPVGAHAAPASEDRHAEYHGP